MWSRRESLSLAMAALAAACTPLAVSSEPKSLDALARAKGLRFGAAMGRGDLGDERYCDIVRRECGVIVSENDHKWPVIHPAPGVFDFEPGDRLVAFTESNAIRPRGHNLVWNNPHWLPRWVNDWDFGANPRLAAEQLLTEHITTICRHYGERIHSWDVVNETIDAGTGLMRETVFTRALGPQAIDLCFHLAKAAAPYAVLVYNDYMGWEAGSAGHRTGVLRLLEGLKSRNVPVDALGLQSHIGAGDAAMAPFDTAQELAWRKFLDDVTGMGFQLLVTELDVEDRSLPADIPRRDRIIADYTKHYLDITLSYPQVKEVLTWGIVDQRSWLQQRDARDDGLAKRPLPYDANYRAKPMREAIAAAFSAAPVRR